MRNKLLLFIVSLFFMQSFLYAQDANQELLRIRDLNYKHYRTFKDTMSIRTWFNMVELSKRLEEVVKVDNVLIDSLLNQKQIAQPVKRKSESQRVSELEYSKNELMTEVARLNAHKDSLTSRKNFYAIGFVLSLLAFLITLGSYISYVQKNKESIKMQKTSKKTLLELRQNHQNEISSLNVEHEKLRTKIEQLKEENELLENSAAEMKKSFEILKEKEQPLENVAEQPRTQEVSEDELAEIRKEINTLSEEVSQIIAEKRSIEEKLDETKQELEKQKKVNYSIGGDIEGLLKKLKGDPHIPAEDDENIDAEKEE